MASFENLPAELRNILYDKILGKPKPQYRAPNELAILTVSKKLHLESSSYLYEHNGLVIDVPSATTKTTTILPPIGDQYLRFLRHLKIHALTGPANCPRTLKAATAIGALSGIGAKFDQLTLVIESPLSHLLNSRVDDSVMKATHPITMAIQAVLRSKVVDVLRIQLQDAWFSSGVAHSLETELGSRLEFLVNGLPVHDISVFEKPLTGRDSSTHLTAFGLNEEESIVFPNFPNASSPLSAPYSLPSSTCSALSNLDAFSVTAFEHGLDHDDQSRPSAAGFFSEEDIEEWSACTQEDQDDELMDDMEDLDVDEEMEEVPQDVMQAYIDNMQDVAHHVANEGDVTYMTNFAPDLLLSRHHLDHLVAAS
jgi:hypothetical protein